MAKDPALLFYPNDYIGGTLGMSFEEKGAYMEILMMQFNRGHMSEDMILKVVGNLWQSFKNKFVQDENGFYYNIRLQEEKEKRAAYTESRRKNKEGKNQYTKSGHMTSHMTGHMENENRNINNTINTIIQEGEISLENCLEIALKDERWLRLNKTSKPELEIFNEKLMTEGVNYKTPIDYKTHFARWKKKDPQELKTQKTFIYK
jgi:uncharacterized protein YdaU (DUF1376 family)